VTPAGGCETFNANPNAPGKLLLSRTTKVPGVLFFNIFMAKREFNWRKEWQIGTKPSSLLMVGLYQNRLVSLTKIG
jgi:hypothetical protein